MTFWLARLVSAGVQWVANNGIKITHNSYGSSGDFGTLGWRHTNEFLQ